MPTVAVAARRGAMVAGVLSSALYITVDLLSAARYPGYSLVNQAISELSAIGAPEASTRLWALLGPGYGLLFALFTLGVLVAGWGNTWLKVSAWLMLAFIAWGMMWPFFPMHQRGTETNLSDLGHLILAGGSLAFITAFTLSGAFAFGDRFRRYSIATSAIVLLTGLVTFAYVPRMGSGATTPGLGVIERVMIYAYLLWIAVLAFALMKDASVSVKGERRILVAQ